MLLLVATAQAALPWECPTLGAVPDGPQFRTDGGLIDTHDALAALVDPWLEGTCAWSDVVLDTGEIASTCTTSVGAVVVLDPERHRHTGPGRRRATGQREMHGRRGRLVPGAVAAAVASGLVPGDRRSAGVDQPADSQRKTEHRDQAEREREDPHRGAHASW